MTVYNILGEEIARVLNEQKRAGRYDLLFDGSKLASGIYFFRIEVNNFVSIKKGVLVK